MMPDLETLIASTLLLMTRHAKSPKAGLEQAIIDSLQMLSCHPDCHSKKLKGAGQRLAMVWRQEARIKELGLDECQPLCVSAKPARVH